MKPAPGQILVQHWARLGCGQYRGTGAPGRRLGAIRRRCVRDGRLAAVDRPPGHPELLRSLHGFHTHIGSAVKKVRLAIELRAAENLLLALSGSEPLDLCEAFHQADPPCRRCPALDDLRDVHATDVEGLSVFR